MSNVGLKIGKNVASSVLSQIPVVSVFSKFCEDFVLDGWQERIDLWKEAVIKRLSQSDAETEQKIRETSNFASILASAIIKDLFENNLIEAEHIVDMRIRGGIDKEEYLPQKLSPLVKDFLAFISERENVHD